MVYQRFAETQVREALGDTPVVALNGPRQSGKATLARMIARPDWQYFTLDERTTLEAAHRDPVGFVREIDKGIIDEIQRAPDLLLKSLIPLTCAIPVRQNAIVAPVKSRAVSTVVVPRTTAPTPR